MRSLESGWLEHVELLVFLEWLSWPKYYCWTQLLVMLQQWEHLTEVQNLDVSRIRF